jgi:hypothetical protein
MLALRGFLDMLTRIALDKKTLDAQKEAARKINSILPVPASASDKNASEKG